MIAADYYDMKNFKHFILLFNFFESNEYNFS